VALIFSVGLAVHASAQSLTYRGFVDAHGTLFPQDAPNDSRNFVGDLLARAELFVRPAPWLGLAAGLDGRVNSYDQVEERWRLDLADRGIRRPALSVRRLSATLNRGPLTLDVGKQFIRWGKADVLTPTDRFAPRDYLNVIGPDFLAVRGVRGVLELGPHTLDLVWVPLFTPSRVPLLDQRWTVPPPGVQLVTFEGDEAIPERSQLGIRWGDTRPAFEYSVSFYDGFNHLPTFDPLPLALSTPLTPPGAPVLVELVRRYPKLRMYGGDAAVPTRWFTAKGEIAYFTTSSGETDEYVLYVVQLERQFGEWSLVAGYAGEAVTDRSATVSFAPDRGTARTVLGRASYTIDANRSAAFEGAVRQDGRGLYLKGEYSQARGRHWRATIDGGLIRGEPDDFLGQYRRNSHVAAALRYSF
jgi:hypothetical protein